MKRLIYFLFFIFTFYSCGTKSIDPLSEENKKLSLEEKIQLALTPTYLDSLGFSNKEIDYLFSFYQTNSFKAIWINDSTISNSGSQLKRILNKNLHFGIPSECLLNLKWEKANFLQTELMLTLQLAKFKSQITYGIFEKDTIALKKNELPSIDSLFTVIKFNHLTQKQIENQIIAWGPQDTSYQKIAHNLYQYCNQHIIDTTTFNVPTFSKDTLNSFLKMKEALISKGYLNSKIQDSISIIETLKIFQKENGLASDGKIGTYTVRALNESTYDKILRTIITLEKWRNHPNYTQRNIRINLPEYALHLTIDSIRENHRIVIGKYETQTPELISSINRIVIYPYWTVPQSIKNKEILPEAQKNANYFIRNNLKILTKENNEIDPLSINWSKYKNTFPFKLRQEYGPKNSLGVIKFEFENPFGVYVHDTPSKSLFSKDIRSFSHGCMRCQNPIGLAKTILKYDCRKDKCNEIDSAKIDSLLLIVENHSIRLLQAIPIYVEYKSVIANRENLVFLIDIYNRDEKYIRLLKK
ncbi:MAG: L,D-transpeptidase family protein [Flavobacteriia bacterium]|nr:L,D-transpeptidase family protein [Flavobacteriia bacterium]